MSLEQAILTHAEAVNRLAAALENRGDNSSSITALSDAPAKAAKPKADKPKAEPVEEPKAEEPEVETNTAGGEVKPISGTATGVATAEAGGKPTVDLPTVAAKVTALVGAGKRAEVVALLKTYDAAKAGDVPEEKRGAFYAELEAIG